MALGADFLMCGWNQFHHALKYLETICSAMSNLQGRALPMVGSHGPRMGVVVDVLLLHREEAGCQAIDVPPPLPLSGLPTCHVDTTAPCPTLDPLPRGVRAQNE